MTNAKAGATEKV